MDFTTTNIKQVKKELKAINKNIKIKTIEPLNYTAILPELELNDKVELIRKLKSYFAEIRANEIKEFFCGQCGETIATNKELCGECEGNEIRGMEYGN